MVTGLLEADWSPQLISLMLPMLFPDDQAMRVSYETIYLSLFIQTRGELRNELTEHLRSGRDRRRPRTSTSSRRKGRITGMTPISERPAEATDRAVPGHWEGDLILGAVSQGAVITLVERHSRFVLLAPLPDTHKAVEVRELLTSMIATLPTELKRSLTWDQGNEMAQHAQFTLDTGLQVYFCNPHSPWERGSNENTNYSYASTGPKAQTCATSPKPTATQSPSASTPDHALHSACLHPHKHSTKHYLQQPIETAALSPRLTRGKSPSAQSRGTRRTTPASAAPASGKPSAGFSAAHLRASAMSLLSATISASEDGYASCSRRWWPSHTVSTSP